MTKMGKNSLIIDFTWTFTANSVQCEDDQKFRTLLKEMFIASTTPFLLLRKDEDELLKIYKEK
jgi:hypothetical protein